MADEEKYSSDGLLHANAWCGKEACGAPGAAANQWSLKLPFRPPQFLAAAEEINPADWRNPEVGWGVVLAEGADVPAPIAELIAHRGNAPILRYAPEPLKYGKLRRYSADGTPSEPGIGGTPGTGPNSVPQYLLIVGSPREIPWSAQYEMQTVRFVGRLDLDPVGLCNYVKCLINGWTNLAVSETPVVWATDHGHPDITWLMRRVIADRLVVKFQNNPEFKMQAGYAAGAAATHAALNEMLAARKSAFVLTSSHGATFPLNNLPAMLAQIGLPVDNDYSVMDIQKASNAWDVAGGIWYAHACCSAGTDSKSAFHKLVAAGSTLADTLTGIAGGGAITAPLPRTLLGRPNPARAFIGHVEPTFDWTLRDPSTGEVTVSHIQSSLYTSLHGANRPPVGLALDNYYKAVAQQMFLHSRALDEFNAGDSMALERARKFKLLAVDRLAMVLLGDPTVALP